MPVYEYGCLKCGKTHEIMQKFSDAPMAACPDCGGEVKKLISHTSFVLKGSGWYVTDYAGNKNPDKDKTTQQQAETKAEEKKPDTAPEAKSETKSETKKEEVAAK
jgi:putative FmdB family regulatory protein